VATIADLVTENYFPSALLGGRWSQRQVGPFRGEGMERMAANPKYDGETVMAIPDIVPELSVASYAFNIAETIGSFFVRGCTEARHQGSLEIAQIWFNVGLDEAQLTRLKADSRYDPNRLVSSLGLHFDPECN
jgi:hypothetical protein